MQTCSIVSLQFCQVYCAKKDSIDLNVIILMPMVFGQNSANISDSIDSYSLHIYVWYILERI